MNILINFFHLPNYVAKLLSLFKRFSALGWFISKCCKMFLHRFLYRYANLKKNWENYLKAFTEKVLMELHCCCTPSLHILFSARRKSIMHIFYSLNILTIFRGTSWQICRRQVEKELYKKVSSTNEIQMKQGKLCFPELNKIEGKKTLPGQVLP